MGNHKGLNTEPKENIRLQYNTSVSFLKTKHHPPIHTVYPDINKGVRWQWDMQHEVLNGFGP